MDEALRRAVWWLPDARNPVIPPGAPGSFDCDTCMNPFVVRDGETYLLYYGGGDEDGHRNICLATAAVSDPATWTRHGVVLERGPAGSFDHNWVVLPHVVRFGDRWHLYYTANSGHGKGLSAFPGIGLAFSDDGRTFTKHPEPVLTPTGKTGDPDAVGIAGGSVIEARLPDGSTEWRFYYTGCPTTGDDVFLDQQKRTCYAVSADGIHWERRGAIMYRDPERDYVNIAAAGPVVRQEEDGSYRMFYSAIGTRWGYYSICCAESDDGITWRRGERYGDDLTIGPSGDGWCRQMVAYPAVVEEGSRLRLFYCGNGYGRTGIGTAVSSPLRAHAVEGTCELTVTAHAAKSRWAYRVPESLSCEEGVIKIHSHPILDWHGPNADGTLWQEWETNDADFAVISAYSRAEEFGFSFTQGLWFRTIVRPDEHGLSLRFTATNTSDRTLHNVFGNNCLGRPSPPFRDDALERTYGEVKGALTALVSTDRGTGDPVRAHYGVEGASRAPFVGEPFWGGVSETTLSSGMILRTREDGRFTIGVGWERVAEVWDNQDPHGCIHSNFHLGDIAPGETKTVRGWVVLVEGGAVEAREVLGRRMVEKS